MWVYILIGCLFLILIYGFFTYNNLIELNNKVKEAFATMDVYLRKRWDLIPNIVETVKGYAFHEKETLESIINLRNNVYDNMDNNTKIETNEKINSNIKSLMILVENYPELKANQSFLDLSKNLTKVEDEIANARKYYNAVVRMINNKIEMFPSNIVSKILGFKSMKMFEANNDEREAIKVSL